MSIPMGWYPVPGTADVRWWDGSLWAPHRLKDGRAAADQMVNESLGKHGLVLGAVLVTVAVLSALPALFGFAAAAMVVGACGAVGVIALVSAQSLRARTGYPSPAAPAVAAESVMPYPLATEASSAGWIPVAPRFSRWWTGARWSPYVYSRHGVRPSTVTPGMYSATKVLAWVSASLGVLLVVMGVVFLMQGWSLGLTPTLLGVLVAAGSVVILINLDRNRDAILIPTTPPVGI